MKTRKMMRALKLSAACRNVGLATVMAGLPLVAATAAPAPAFDDARSIAARTTFTPAASGAELQVASLPGVAFQNVAKSVTGPETAVAWVRKEVVPPPAPVEFSAGQPGPYSALPWHSGAACSGADFEGWRKRSLDMEVGWAPKDSWTNFVKFSANLRYIANRQTWYTVGLPMLTAEVKGQFANAAAGAFDTYYQQFAQNMVDLNMGDSIIRIGWEANGSWYPWAANGQVEAYKATFRRIAAIFKAASPAFKIEWSNARKGNVLPIDQMYPGDDVVDFVGISYYDRFKSAATQADWKAGRDQWIVNSPVGIGAWLSFAKSHGKFLAVSEWGINNGFDQGGTMGVAGDDAIFVQNMYSFFKANARFIAYEDYFNCPQSNSGEYYQVFPSTYNPKSSATYLKNWMNGN